MKLYLSPGACSMSCHIAFEEAKFKFEPKIGDWEMVEKLNPQGAVPILVLEDGKSISQNVAILTYAYDKAPQLMPKAGSDDYYEACQWLSWTSSDLHPTFADLFNDKFPEEARKESIANVHKLLAQVEKHMDGKTFLAGEQFTVADCLFFTVYGWTKRLEIPTDKYTNLNNYSDRITERPAVKTVMQREGLSR